MSNWDPTSLANMERHKTKFRGKMGVRLILPLFWETTKGTKEHVLYTLKSYDWKGYPSLHRLYMEMEDLTEYEFANAYFEDWDHWLMVSASPQIKPYLDKWRKELDLKIKAEALRAVREEAKDKTSKNRFRANQILLDRSWEDQQLKPLAISTRGRPSKQDIENTKKDIAEAELQAERDLERLMNGRLGGDSTEGIGSTGRESVEPEGDSGLDANRFEGDYPDTGGSEGWMEVPSDY